MKAILLLALGMVLLCVNPVLSKTRSMLGLGFDFAGPNGSSLSPHLSATMDAPSAVRRHLPLEFGVGLTGPYDHERNTYTVGAPYGGGLMSYYRWEPRFSVSEAVRIYAIGRANKKHVPDGMEVGLGLANHQFVSDRHDGSSYQTYGTRVETQWRASAFFRANFQPRSRTGMFMELEYQRGIFANENYYLPVNSVLMQFGYRFPV